MGALWRHVAPLTGCCGGGGNPYGSCTGFTKTDEMVAALDGPHVGVGVCMGLVDDHHGMIEFQCCWTTPRIHGEEVLATGALSIVTHEAVLVIKVLVLEHTQRIAQYFGLAPEKLRLIRLKHTLYVHVCNWEPIEPAYQMGAIYVCMVSLLVGRRPRTDTAIFGDVTTVGVFISKWKWSEKEVEVCKSKGIRRVVLGAGTEVLKAAQAMADVIHEEDGRPTVEFKFETRLVNVLPHMFE